MNPADALSPNKAISQYLREEWSAEQGFPGGEVYAIAQTPDGYLWIGTEKGLVRFDGLRFQLFEHSSSPEFPSGPIVGLVVDAEGTLWVRPRGLKLLRYNDGEFQDILQNVQVPEGDVTAMCLSRNGEILFFRLGGGATRYNKGHLVPVAPGGGLPRLIISLAETEGGTVWMGTREQGLFYLSDGRVSALSQSLRDQKINALLPISEHEIWIGTDTGVARWDGKGISRLGAPRSLERASAFAMIRDRDSNIWVGTSRGLARIDSRGGFSTEQTDNASSAVSALFEDREGNLWVGTARGVERLRDSVFTTYPASNGLLFENNGPVLVDLDGRTWFAPTQGGLYWFKEGQLGQVSEGGLGKDVIYSIDGRKGELWIGRRRKGITHLRYEGNAFKAETYTQAEGLAQNSVSVVHENRDGTIWAGTFTGGLSRLRDGNFKTYTAASGLASNSISAIAESSDGTTWIGTPNGLTALSNGQWRTYTSRDNLPAANVNCLLVDSSGTLWIGTSAGLAFLASGTINSVIGLAEPLRESILGIEEDRTGSLWVATANRIVRVERAKLLRQELTSADIREYGLADGLHSTQVVQRQRSVVADSLGRIWFSTSRGISFVDPRPMTSDSTPALVHLEAILADGREIDLRRDFSIPASHRRITLRYIALSLAVPARVRYMYKLEPFDKAWSEPVSAREAVYTNLSPGSYRFRVLASNSDALWNSSELSIPLTIAPMFWQTWWFRTGSVASILLLVWCAHLYRLHQLAKEFNIRLQERIGERTRVARELHDSLLQGFQGMMFRLQAVRDLLPGRPSEAMQVLDVALERGDKAIAEGRDTVSDLRGSIVGDKDLAEALTALGEELAAQGDNGAVPYIRVSVEGKQQELNPMLRDEIYRIAREALRNAFRHAKAQKIETEITYGDSEFLLRVRDDGSGIDSRVANLGARAGHWGLPGMLERAKSFGGKLEVWSEHGAGTEIELIVPADVAYGKSDTRRRFWFSRKKIGGADGQHS